jgi:hypothetical protein
MVGLDIDYIEAHIDGEARERFDALPLLKKILMVRAVTELSICLFRHTRHDPDYHPNEYESWVLVIKNLIGTEGIERLGV